MRWWSERIKFCSTWPDQGWSQRIYSACYRTLIQNHVGSLEKLEIILKNWKVYLDKLESRSWKNWRTEALLLSPFFHIFMILSTQVFPTLLQTYCNHAYGHGQKEWIFTWLLLAWSAWDILWSSVLIQPCFVRKILIITSFWAGLNCWIRQPSLNNIVVTDTAPGNFG